MTETQNEVDKNYEFFKTLKFESNQKGHFALLHGRKLIAILETRQDTLVMGKSIFPDGIFSIQEIDAAIIDLGFQSYVVPSI